MKYEFRGLKTDKSGWIYGIPTYDFKYIFSEEQVDSPDNYEVIPETVGMLGYKIFDYKNYNGVSIVGTKVFEGDLLAVEFKDYLELDFRKCVGEVVFCNGQFDIRYLNRYMPLKDFIDNIKMSKGGVIIGNIHQNSTLLTHQNHEEEKIYLLEKSL